MSLSVVDLAPAIASEIRATKAELLNGVHADTIRDLLERRGVLVFPQVGFSDAEQIEFTQTLGTFAPERMVCADGSGDTEFANTYAAYDALDDVDKHAFDTLRVMHSAWNTLFYYEPEPSYTTLRAMMAIGDRELPLVWNHRSGRKSLVLGCTARHVVDMDFRTSVELLVRLRDWATRPEFVYRHHWTVGDLVIWDNTGTMHRATPYDPQSGRLLHRTKLEGEEPFA
ncbi:MAG: TauD/TfdA family dioxygenase [Mycolicibacterium aromaticivorans]|nr:TauD/TfdA family dioxygenase [Mycolicibacterium aromaticivorans]